MFIVTSAKGAVQLLKIVIHLNIDISIQIYTENRASLSSLVFGILVRTSKKLLGVKQSKRKYVQVSNHSEHRGFRLCVC